MAGWETLGGGAVAEPTVAPEGLEHLMEMTGSTAPMDETVLTGRRERAESPPGRPIFKLNPF